MERAEKRFELSEKKVNELATLTQSNRLKAETKVEELLAQIKSYTKFDMPFALNALSFKVM